jgi:enoyl-CoA hydratase/carnithine racemase
MSSSNVVWEIDGPIATLTFNRPQARNALTWDMYDALVEACEFVDATPAIRVMIIRGAGGVFSAGTDISQFASFATGNDGIAYERRLDAAIDRLEAVTCITIAAIHGIAVGGGCAIALACDLRVCARRARLGVPVARTLGNCLSAANVSRLVDHLGVSRTTDLLLTGRLLTSDEIWSLGLCAEPVADEQLDTVVREIAADLTDRARSTIVATKTLLRRVREHRRAPAADDVIAACYTSDDFREGVRAFLAGRDPQFRTTPSK